MEKELWLKRLNDDAWVEANIDKYAGQDRGIKFLLARITSEFKADFSDVLSDEEKINLADCVVMPLVQARFLAQKYCKVESAFVDISVVHTVEEKFIEIYKSRYAEKSNVNFLCLPTIAAMYQQKYNDALNSEQVIGIAKEIAQRFENFSFDEDEYRIFVNIESKRSIKSVINSSSNLSVFSKILYVVKKYQQPLSTYFSRLNQDLEEIEPEFIEQWIIKMNNIEEYSDVFLFVKKFISNPVSYYGVPEFIQYIKEKYSIDNLTPETFLEKVINKSNSAANGESDEEIDLNTDENIVSLAKGCISKIENTGMNKLSKDFLASLILGSLLMQPYKAKSKEILINSICKALNDSELSITAEQLYKTYSELNDKDYISKKIEKMFNEIPENELFDNMMLIYNVVSENDWLSYQKRFFEEMQKQVHNSEFGTTRNIFELLEQFDAFCRTVGIDEINEFENNLPKELRSKFEDKIPEELRSKFEDKLPNKKSPKHTDEKKFSIKKRFKPQTSKNIAKVTCATLAGVGIISFLYMTIVRAINHESAIENCADAFYRILPNELLSKIFGNVGTYFASIASGIGFGFGAMSFDDDDNIKVEKIVKK